MRYVILVSLVAVICLAASPVYAWPEPKQSPECRLVMPNDGGYATGIFQGERWPKYVSNSSLNNIGAPPQLDASQSYRWSVSPPTGKAQLAQLWNIPEDVATQYGAKFLKILGR